MLWRNPAATVWRLGRTMSLVLRYQSGTRYSCSALMNLLWVKPEI